MRVDFEYIIKEFILGKCDVNLITAKLSNIMNCKFIGLIVDFKDKVTEFS